MRSRDAEGGRVVGVLPGMVLLVSLIVLLSEDLGALSEKGKCAPTQPDALGPFYKPDAPVRSRVGQGYLLSGTVRSSVNCKPIAAAKIEFWLAGPDAVYGDLHRATVYADGAGNYRFESNVPPAYAGRPPHIHVRVSAEGYKTLVTQHYPAKGETEARSDLVLVPVR